MSDPPVILCDLDGVVWLARQAIPGSEPTRAAEILEPIAAARQAVIYQGFLDGIEPSEHPYHRADPAVWLRRAAELARRSADREG
jgi:hypothetical protein